MNLRQDYGSNTLPQIRCDRICMELLNHLVFKAGNWLQIVDFEVMVRPFSGLQALGAEMGERLGQQMPTFNAKD